MKFILNVMLFLMGLTLTNGQVTYQITGRVSDAHDNSVLAEAKIQMGEFTATSDLRGNFKFRNVPAGSYDLKASHPECELLSEQIVVRSNMEITLKMEHHIADIETVTLHGSHKKSGSVIIKTLSREDITRNTTENLGNLLTGISGVTSLKTGNNISKPVIHGLYGTRISVVNNGVKMAEQEWGVEHAPNVDVNMFEHIDVIKGASVLKYGNEGVGGVVVLESGVAPRKDTLTGNLSFSGISNGMGGEVSAGVAKTWVNQWFVRAGGGYKKTGDQYVPHHTLQNTGAEVGSFNFSFGNHSFTQGFDVSYSGIQQQFGIFKGAHLGGPEDFYHAINFGQPYFLDDFSYNIRNPKQEVAHHIAKITAYRRFVDWGKFTFQYSFQLNDRKEYDIRKGKLSEVPSMDLTLMTHNAGLNHLIERENWSLESGISGGFQDNFPDPSTEARRLIPDYYRYDAGLFSVFKYRFSQKLNVEAGARYDFARYDAYKYYDKAVWEKYASVFPQFFVKESGSRILARPVLDYHMLSANVGLNYRPVKNLDFKVNVSRTERAPNPAELFADGLHHSAAIIEEGDLNIQKEAVYNLNVSALANLDVLKGLTLEVNPYLMYADTYINQIPTSVKSTNRGVFVVWGYQQIRARIYGIDADVHLQISDQLRLNSSFSTLRGDDLQNSEPLILMMPTTFRNGIEWKAAGKRSLYVRLENESVLKQNRFPVRDQQIDFIQNGNVVSKVVDYSTPPGAYSVFNAAFGADLFKNVNFNLRINNLFNTEYREYLNRLRYFMQEPGRNVVATLQIKF